MVVNKVFEDPRGVECVFCYTDTTIPLDSIVTIDGAPARISKVFTPAEGWNPGPSSSNQGVIGFNYTGQNYTYGDTFNITNSSFTLPVSGYSIPSYGSLVFSLNGGFFNSGSFLTSSENYFNVGEGEDFTVEFLFNWTQISSPTFFFSFFSGPNVNANNILSLIWTGSYIQAVVNNNGCSFYDFDQNAFSTNTWNHIALVRSGGGNIQCYLNGVQSGAGVAPVSDSLSGVIQINLGGFYYEGNAAASLNGKISNFRVTPGQAIYTSNFSPVNLPLSIETNTTILLLATTEETKYLNSVDSVSFSCFAAPTDVAWETGPIAYPPIPPVYSFYYTPTNYTFDWYEGPNFTGTAHYSETLLGFTTATVSAVATLNFSNGFTLLSGFNNYPNLQTVEIIGADLSEIDLSGCTSLDTFKTENTPLTFLNIYNCTNLSGLTAKSCSLPSLTLPSSAPNLQFINLYQNSLTSLDVSSYTNLYDLACGGNLLSNITLGTLPNLTRLTSGSNLVSTLDISGLSALSYLDHQGNQGFTQLTALDISNNVSLENVYLSQNLIPSLNFSNCPNIYYVEIGSNLLTDLNFNNKSALYVLNCFGNLSLSSLNITNCTALNTLDCHFTDLSSLNITTNTNLAYLIAYNNYNFTTAVVDQLLNDLATNAVANSIYYGQADLSGCAPRSSASNAAVSTLAGSPYYWSIYTT